MTTMQGEGGEIEKTASDLTLFGPVFHHVVRAKL